MQRRECGNASSSPDTARPGRYVFQCRHSAQWTHRLHELPIRRRIRGANVVVSSRRQASCDAVVDEIRAMGCEAVAIPCHVGHWSELESLIEGAIAAFDRLDVLVNNAGLAPSVGSSTNVTEELFDKTFAVNAKGPFRLSTLAEPHLRKTQGCIINVSSTAAIRPEPAYPVYAAAKGALNIITRSQALEFGPNVRVNAIMAGPFWTDMSAGWREEYGRNATSAIKRIGQPHEIVSTALYLASPSSTYVTGAIVQLDGGIL